VPLIDKYPEDAAVDLGVGAGHAERHGVAVQEFRVRRDVDQFCVRVACRHGEPRDLAIERDHVAALHGPDDVVAGAARCVAAREGVVTEAGAEEVVPASANESVVVRAAGQAI
jgi:hypothetical protein